ncbi:hypothetical protein Ciccas_003428 [Cichlidogyrus casuarinus]|uniref:Uncharacterized protein n=1 Tax=Cichlidogyrus casuarinus TaxID=1844966 RepID=A0ABD2QGQ0_9PLAT
MDRINKTSHDRSWCNPEHDCLQECVNGHPELLLGMVPHVEEEEVIVEHGTASSEGDILGLLTAIKAEAKGSQSVSHSSSMAVVVDLLSGVDSATDLQWDTTTDHNVIPPFEQEPNGKSVKLVKNGIVTEKAEEEVSVVELHRQVTRLWLRLREEHMARVESDLKIDQLSKELAHLSFQFNNFIFR